MEEINVLSHLLTAKGAYYNALILSLNPDCEEAKALVYLNLLALSPYWVGLRLILVVYNLIFDSDSDTIDRQCHTHTVAYIVRYIVINFRQWCGRAIDLKGGVIR